MAAQKKPTVAVATDSNSGITQAQGTKHGIGVIPMPFLIDGTEYFEDVSITREEFFQKLEEGADVQTSQPSPESVTALWDKLLEEYEEVVYIPMSGGLSNSVQTALMLSESYEGRVQVVDNHRISCSQKQSVLQAVKLAREGRKAAEIKAFLLEHALDASIYIAVDTLKYLKKGGRVTAAGAALGTILNIKPVLQIQGEKLDAYAKVRGMKLAQTKMLEAVKNDIESRFAGEEVLIKGAYTCDEKSLSQWKKALSSAFPKHKISLDPLALSISCHIGAGSMAVVCMKIEPEADGVSFEL
ncbi:DegV family protein [Neglectibacter caecimuris]|uniref:DegV family protein n=1 Tax=Neglectibacter caecimuris TaxID=3093658 RepID=UPI002AC8C776|nr:DegV family protein [Neglectibacter sp. M00184]